MGSFKSVLIRIAYATMRMLPVNRKRVLIFSYYGEHYSGSPKYIGRYLTEHSDLDVVWAFIDPKKQPEYKGKTVRYGRLAYYYCLATSRFIITNYRMTADFKKRAKQKYIQTWHSSLRLKMIENDAADTLPLHYIEMAKNDSRNIDYLLAGCKKSREIFEQSFWYNGPIINTGTPQCDILLGDNSKYINKVYEHFHIPLDAHIALYAPTFRKNNDTSVYNLDTDALLNALQKRFGGKWYLLMRLHPHLIGKLDCFRYTDTVLQATDYNDVQELLCASSLLISDYSAIIFDYAVTRKPCFLYTPDLADYTANDRKLYFAIEELPFIHAPNHSELLDSIRNFSSDTYEQEITGFLQRIGSFDDGQASKRVYELIQEECK